MFEARQLPCRPVDNNRQLEFAFTIPQTLALGTTKISILFFFLRIFRGRPFIVSTWMLIVLSSIWTVVCKSRRLG